MNHHNPNNMNKSASKKHGNLSELSISNIWESRHHDESSEFQNEKYLIHAIKVIESETAD